MLLTSPLCPSPPLTSSSLSHDARRHPSSRLSSHSSILSIQIPDSHIKSHSHLPFNLLWMPPHVQLTFASMPHRKVIINTIRFYSMCFFLYVLRWALIPFYSIDHVQAL